MDEVAEELVYAGFILSVVFFGDGAGLAAKFEAEDLFFEAFHGLGDLVIDLGGKVRGRGRRDWRCWR